MIMPAHPKTWDFVHVRRAGAQARRLPARMSGRMSGRPPTVHAPVRRGQGEGGSIPRTERAAADAARGAIMGRMAEHTQLIDAINIRTAIRAYDEDPIEDDTVRQLQMTLDPINLLADLNLQLILDRPKVFAEANDSGHLANARHFIGVVGPKDDDEARERAGFYAERIVLAATLRGLGTLWVAGSWDRELAARVCSIPKGRELYLGIVIGHPANHLDRLATPYSELAERARTHRATKTYERFTAPMGDEAREQAPAWFRAGVEAAMKAPSAMNRQPVLFDYDPATGSARATLDPQAGDERWGLNDLGIAKLHFQIGAGQGSWTWGDGGTFTHR